MKWRTFQVPAPPPPRDPWAPDRLEPGKAGEDDVASAVVFPIEQVAGQGSPQVEAGRPGQQRVLEAGSEVRAVSVHRQIGVLGTERTGQRCSSCDCRMGPLRQGRGWGLGGAPRALGIRRRRMVMDGQRANEQELAVCTLAREAPDVPVFPFSSLSD